MNIKVNGYEFCPALETEPRKDGNGVKVVYTGIMPSNMSSLARVRQEKNETGEPMYVDFDGTHRTENELRAKYDH
jgi:hypothetical protein